MSTPPSTLTACAACRAPVSVNASACPHCGEPRTPAKLAAFVAKGEAVNRSMMNILWLLCGVAAVLALGLAVATLVVK